MLIPHPAREQHIRREKATSNICTSQALLANTAAMYAVYHGPEGLRQIAQRVHGFTSVLKSAVEDVGFKAVNSSFFDTLTVDVSGASLRADDVHAASVSAGINLRKIDAQTVGITLDESVGASDLLALVNVFRTAASASPLSLSDLSGTTSGDAIPSALARTSAILPHPVFNKHHSETEMLRYIHHLQSKDLSLTHAMIPLGSCTMKLNSTSSMIPLTWPEFGNVHPFVPTDQVKGYRTLIQASRVLDLFVLRADIARVQELEDDLCRITGFHGCSLQPNSGAAGEYAGLTVIKRFHEANGQGERDICLIPVSAHGTNPAVSFIALHCNPC
jgi:glycine dehydrogenase